MPHAESLQTRLAWRLGLVFLVATAVAVGGLTWRAVTTIDSLNDRALQAQAQDIVRHLSADADGRPRLDLPAELRAAYRRADGAFLYVVYGPDGAALAASSPRAARLFGPHVEPDGGSAFFRVDAGDDPLGPFYGYATPAGRFTVAVAQGRLHADVLLDSLVAEFIEHSLWLVVAVVVAALAVGVLTIRDGLAPLTALSAHAARIGPGAAHLRLPEERLPRELKPLVRAVNDALDRLERGFEVQRRFTADAAHELRTPLAILTARIDGLDDGPEKAALGCDVERMNRLVEQLLRVARLDAESLDVSRPVDLRAVAREALGALAPLAVARGRHLALVGAAGPVTIRGDAAALGAALSNLIENALAQTPEGGRVDVEVAADGSVSVMDRGPGVPAGDRGRIFERFWRGRRSAPGPGAGLGLAIVAEVVREHGGRIEVGDRPGGGAVFTLRLNPA